MKKILVGIFTVLWVFIIGCQIYVWKTRSEIRKINAQTLKKLKQIQFDLDQMNKNLK